MVDVALMNDVVRFASGDPAKALLMGTSVSERRVFVLFEYENAEHDPDVKVLGFRVRKHIRPLCTPTSAPAYINTYVTRWMYLNEHHDCNFPHRAVLLPPGVPNPWAQKPKPKNQQDGEGGEGSRQGGEREPEVSGEQGQSNGHGEKGEHGGDDDKRAGTEVTATTTTTTDDEKDAK